MPENDTHELVDVLTSVRWDMVPTYQWQCSCDAISAVRWATKSKACKSYVVHHQEENDGN